MSPESINLLTQIPLVGIFVFFVWLMWRENRKERSEESEKWREFLRIQQETFTTVLTANTDALKEIGVDVEEHHKTVSDAITRMLERTAIKDKSGGKPGTGA